MKRNKVQAENAQKAIAIARAHVAAGKTSGMRGSAQIRLDGALACLGRGDYAYAIRAAKDSVDYSLGMFSTESKQIAAMLA